MLFYSRESPRAQWYDYASAGVYFVTICTKGRQHYFGQIKNGEMELNDIGKICYDELHIMIKKRKNIDLDEYIIMPNHIHILLTTYVRKDDGLPRPKKKDNASVCLCLPINIKNQSLGSIIGGRKSAVSRNCNKQGFSFARQSRYHDHIIRDEKAYNNIKYYIQNNPLKRQKDTLYIDYHLTQK